MINHSLATNLDTINVFTPTFPVSTVSTVKSPTLLNIEPQMDTVLAAKEVEAFTYNKPSMSFQSGLESFSSNLGSISESIISASDAVKNVKLPAVKTESTVGISPTTWLGLGALIIVFIYFRKKF